MNFFGYMKNVFTGGVMDEAETTTPDMVEHDKRYHGGHAPEGSCKFRDEIKSMKNEDTVSKGNVPSGVGRMISVLKRWMPQCKIKQVSQDDVRRMVSDNVRKSISNIYTGSAADYEKPSLQYIGTGEGSQVYGWGLYGSNKRGVAERYAESDALRKERFDPTEKRALFNGKSFASFRGLIRDALRGVEKTGSVDNAIKFLENLSDGNNPEVIKMINWLKSNRKSIGWRGREQHEYVYEQTFFTNRAPGDESHLLNWYEPVSDENMSRIANAIKDAGGLFDTYKLPSGATTYIFSDKEAFGNKGTFVKNAGEMPNGVDVYNALSAAYGSPKAASEFLARADIDGVKYPVDSYGKQVKDGDEVGWNYVSFRDDNIRVDHKWVDGDMRFAISAADTISNRNLGITTEQFRQAVERKILDHSIDIRGSDGELLAIKIAAERFFERYRDKKIRLSTGAYLLFVPDERAVERSNGNIAEAWAEYAIHQVTGNSMDDTKKYYREFNEDKVNVVNTAIQDIVENDTVDVSKTNGNVMFYKQMNEGQFAYVVAKPLEDGNYFADLGDVSSVLKKGKIPNKLNSLVRVAEGHARRGIATSPSEDIQIISKDGSLRNTNNSEKSGTVAGWYNRKTGDVSLVKDIATPETVAHGLGWHATFHWAEKNHPELHAKLMQYAREATDGIKKSVVEKYGHDLDEKVLLDEIGAERFTREDISPLLEAASRKESEEWFDKVENAQDGVRREFVRSEGQKLGKSEIDRIAALPPKKAVEELVKAMVSGKTLAMDSVTTDLKKYLRGEHPKPTSVTEDGSMVYRDVSGQLLGTAETFGGRTIFRDKYGRQVSSVEAFT